MEEKTQEKKEIKVKYKTVMLVIIAIEVVAILGTIIYGIIK